MNRWKALVLGGVLLVLSGCYDAAIELNRLYGLDCRPEVMQRHGGCMPVPPGRLSGNAEKPKE